MSGAEGNVTPLKSAFAAARASRDMGGVLPVFLAADLFVVAVPEGEVLNLYITASPLPERMCVTVSESRAALASVDANLVHAISPRALLAQMVGNWDIVIVYGDGGDVLQREYLPDLRAMLGFETRA